MWDKVALLCLLTALLGLGQCQQHDSGGSLTQQQQLADSQQNQQQISQLLPSQSQIVVNAPHQNTNGPLSADSLGTLAVVPTSPATHLTEQAQEAPQTRSTPTPQRNPLPQQQLQLQSTQDQVSQQSLQVMSLQKMVEELQQQRQMRAQPLQQQQQQQQLQQPQVQQQQQTVQPTLVQYQVAQAAQAQPQPVQQVAPPIPEPPSRIQESASNSHQASLQARQQAALTSYTPTNYHHHPNSPLYYGHNPFIEILKPQSYADDNIVTLNLSHSHIYEIDGDAFVGQRFEHIDLSNNKLGLIHSRSFRIGPNHSRHSPYNPHSNSSKQTAGPYPTRRPPPAHPKSVTIDFSHNPAIVALSGAFDHIDVPNCLLNFTNSTVELKFGAFKKYFKEHPGHIIDIESVDCCEQEWLLGYKHNFVTRTHCDHDPNLFLSKVSQQSIIDSCIAYVTSARHSMTIQGPSIIHQVATGPRAHSPHTDNQYLTYLILGGTAMILTSLSIYIIFYMFSLKAAFVYQMQNKS